MVTKELNIIVRFPVASPKAAKTIRYIMIGRFSVFVNVLFEYNFLKRSNIGKHAKTLVTPSK